MSTSLASPRAVHLAHHWFASRRGGERTFEEIASLFPAAEVSTLVCDPAALGGDLPSRRIRRSRLARISPRWIDHRRLLPLYPWAVRGLRVPPETRLLLTSDASLLKGMRKPPGCVHVCYCYSPPRYLWDLAEEYLARTSNLGGIGRWVFRRLLGRLRAFDLQAAAHVDHFIADSRFVAERIRRTYGRESEVIYAPVEVARFTPVAEPGDYYLVVSELVAYKRTELAVRACAASGRKLIVVGSGPEWESLRALAGPTVQLLGRRPDAEVAELMARCRALLHPQVEDFGITPVETQAAGRPVIAFRAGGALETVLEGRTGLFFEAQSPESLVATLEEFERPGHTWDQAACRAQAERFGPERFRAELRTFLTARGFDLDSGDAPGRASQGPASR